MWGPATPNYDVDFSGKWTHEISYYSASFSNENNFTGLVGLDVALPVGFEANIQGRFVSSTALTISVSYCF